MQYLRRLLSALLGREPPLARELVALDRRVAVLEASTADFRDAVTAEAERAARWVDMQAQLRRFLGRLDAHAGKDREQEANGHRDPKQLAAILRTKFPNAGG